MQPLGKEDPNRMGAKTSKSLDRLTVGDYSSSSTAVVASGSYNDDSGCYSQIMAGVDTEPQSSLVCLLDSTMAARKRSSTTSTARKQAQQKRGSVSSAVFALIKTFWRLNLRFEGMRLASSLVGERSLIVRLVFRVRRHGLSVVVVVISPTAAAQGTNPVRTTHTDSQHLGGLAHDSRCSERPPSKHHVGDDQQR